MTFPPRDGITEDASPEQQGEAAGAALVRVYIGEGQCHWIIPRIERTDILQQKGQLKKNDSHQIFRELYEMLSAWNG